MKLRRMRWAGHAACMGKRRDAYRVLVGILAGKKTLRRHRRRWEDNAKKNLRSGMSTYGLD